MLIHCCILLDFLCELYYDARIHEHHVFSNTCEINDLSFVDLVSLSEIPEQIKKYLALNHDKITRDIRLSFSCLRLIIFSFHNAYVLDVNIRNPKDMTG
jgi:hypothetical protein